MSFTFDDSLSTARDRVRFYIGDITAPGQVSDEAIATLLGVYSDDEFEAAAALCDGLAVRYAKIASISIDGLTVKGSDRAEQFRITASNLRRQASEAVGGALGLPFVGGVSIGEMEAVEQDTDRVPNKFTTGMTDFPGTIETANGPAQDDTSSTN